MRVRIRVVRSNGFAILFAPTRAPHLRELFSQSALESSGKIDARVTSSVQQVSANTNVRRAFRN